MEVSGSIKIIWASDAYLEDLIRVCPDAKSPYMVGPHHGAPIDRGNGLAESWLRSVGAKINIISVGSRNRYDHPQKSYIRKAVAAGSRITCTQITPLCDKGRTKDVIKAHARYALPQPNTGIACRGPVRAMLLPSDDIIGDDLDAEHQEAIRSLQRPQCILLAPKRI